MATFTVVLQNTKKARIGNNNNNNSRKTNAPSVSVHGIILRRDRDAHTRQEFKDARHGDFQLVQLGLGSGDEGAQAVARDLVREHALALIVEELDHLVALGELRRNDAKVVQVDRREGVTPGTRNGKKNSFRYRLANLTHVSLVAAIPDDRSCGRTKNGKSPTPTGWFNRVGGLRASASLSAT